MRFRSVLAAAAVLFATCLHSNARAQTGAYVQITGQSNDLTSNGYFWGPTFGLYHDTHSLTLLHLGADFRGSFLKNGSASYTSGLGGLRASIVPHVVPIKVYGEALGGIGVVDNGGSSTHFQYQINGGLEYTILPRIDWRAIEVAYNGFSGNVGGNPIGLSTGIVLRIF